VPVLRETLRGLNDQLRRLHRLIGRMMAAAAAFRLKSVDSERWSGTYVAGPCGEGGDWKSSPSWFEVAVLRCPEPRDGVVVSTDGATIGRRAALSANIRQAGS